MCFTIFMPPLSHRGIGGFNEYDESDAERAFVWLAFRRLSNQILLFCYSFTFLILLFSSNRKKERRWRKKYVLSVHFAACYSFSPQLAKWRNSRRLNKFQRHRIAGVSVHGGSVGSNWPRSVVGPSRLLIAVNYRARRSETYAPCMRCQRSGTDSVCCAPSGSSARGLQSVGLYSPHQFLDSEHSIQTVCTPLFTAVLQWRIL